MEYGSGEAGCHLYCGWFYIVGEIVTAGERNCDIPDSQYFSFFFTAMDPPAKSFRVDSQVAIEFTVHMKWVLAESPDSGRYPALQPG